MTRNRNIDMVKFIAAIFVVAIHTHPLKQVSETIDFIFVEVICRLAVPFFAICTGYYLSKAIEQQGRNSSLILRSCLKTLRLYTSWSLFYLVVLTISWLENGSDVSTKYYTGWLCSFVFSFSYYHLWYLSSMIYGMMFFYFVYRSLTHISPLFLACLLWVIQTINYTYKDFFPENVSVLFGCTNLFPALFNGLTLMLPFLLCGCYLAKKHKKKNERRYFVAFLLSFLLLTLEAFHLQYLHGIEKHSFIFFTIVCSFFLFASILSSKGDESCIKRINTQTLGKISITIYLIHPFFLYLLSNTGVNSFLEFLYTSILSIISGLLICRIKQRVV